MMGERIPTETDLRRLCDAAIGFRDYYLRTVNRSRGMVQQIDEHLSTIERLTMVIPCPRWFFFSFDSVRAPLEPPSVQWHGWSDDHWTAFVELIEACRAVVLAWYSVKQDAIEDGQELKPLQRVGTLPDSEALRQVEAMAAKAERLASLCQKTLCEVQIDILKALGGKSLTKEQLCKECNIGQTRLYGNREKNGGLYELMRLDLVRNGADDDSGIKGYYRPDSPPE